MEVGSTIPVGVQRLSLLEGLLAHSNDVAYVIARNYTIICHSDRCIGYHIAAEATLLDQPVGIVLGDELLQSLAASFERGFSGVSCSVRRTSTANELLFQPYAVNVTPLIDESGVWALVATFVGLDDQYKSNDFVPVQLQSGVIKSAELSWELDVDLRFIFLATSNPGDSAIEEDWRVGKTLEEVILTIYGVSNENEIDFGDFDKQAFREQMLALKEHRAINNYIWPRPTVSTMRWMCINAHPLYSRGENPVFTGYAGISQDITEVRTAFMERMLINRAIDSISTGIAVFDRQNKLLQFNKGLQNILNLKPSDIFIGQPIEDVLCNSIRIADPELASVELDAVVQSTMKKWDGTYSKVEWRDANGNWLRLDSERTPDGLMFIEVREINNQKNIERQLAKERNLLGSLLSSIQDVIYAVDTEHRFILANEAAANLYNAKSVDELIGSRQTERVSHKAARRITAEQIDIMETRMPLINQEVSYTHPESGKTQTLLQTKTPLLDDKDRIIGVVAHAKDVTHLYELTEQLTYLADHDPLTGLINRRGFSSRIQQAITLYKEKGELAVVCYIDLDQFKIVNDTAGHHAGDALLCQVGQLLQTRNRNNDSLARLGGDEFGLVFFNCEITDALKRTKEILSELQNFRFQWEGKLFEIGASVGAVELNDGNLSTSAILSSADVACYTAKDLGRGRVYVFSEDDQESIQRRNELEWAGDIRSAIDEDRFVVYVQPIVKVQNQLVEIHHYEALVRMISREGELVPPGMFIPAAERYKLMGSVDRWVVHNVLDAYPTVFGKDSGLTITINLSGNSLNDPELTEFVKTELRNSGVDSSYVCFELTETAFVSNLAVAQSFVNELSALGCSFALDDFGSGLSSFAYLKNFNIDYLKIDGGFVRNMVDDSTDYAMVAAIHNVGHTLGIETIAEFVETEAHIKALTDIGVDYLQGYGVGKPEPMLQLHARKAANG